MMYAVLGTLPFLATLWLVVTLGAVMLEASGSKIVAALRGTGQAVEGTGFRPVQPRSMARQQTTRPVTAEWRAAA